MSNTLRRDKIAEKQLKTETKDMENYWTIHESKNDLEQFWIFDAGSIDGRILTPEELLGNQITKKEFYKNREEEKLIRENQGKEYLRTEKKDIYSLDRFTLLSNGSMLEDLDGEYVLFSSVLNLFVPKI